MDRMTRWAGRLVGATAVLALAACGPHVSSLGVEAAVMPDAELVVRASPAAQEAAPATQKLRAMAKELDPKAQQAQQQALRALGLSEKDIRTLVASANVDALFTANGPQGPDPSKLRWVVGLALTKALHPSRLTAVLKGGAVQQHQEVTVQGEWYKGLRLLRVGGPMIAQSKVLQEVSVGFSPNHRVLYLGNDATVRAALDRLLTGGAGQPAAPAAVAKAVPGQPAMVAAFGLTPELQTRWRQAVATLDADKANRAEELATTERALKQLDAAAGAGGPGEQFAKMQAASLRPMLEAKKIWLQHADAVTAALKKVPGFAVASHVDQTLTYELVVPVGDATEATRLAEFAGSELKLLTPSLAAVGLSGVQPTAKIAGASVVVSVSLTPEQVLQLAKQAQGLSKLATPSGPGAPQAPAPVQRG